MVTAINPWHIFGAPISVSLCLLADIIISVGLEMPKWSLELEDWILIMVWMIIVMEGIFIEITTKDLLIQA